MAFKEKQNFVGATGQFLGQQSAIYGKYIISSGQVNGDISLYERGDDGFWVFSKIIGSYLPDFGISLDIFKGNAAIGSVDNQSIAIHSSDDNFSTPVFLNPSSASPGFGKSVSISDSFIAVGSPERNANEGAVFLYKKSGNDWVGATEDYILTPDDAKINQFFGTSVAINDDFLIVGAKGDNQSRGASYVFTRDEDTGVWEQSQKIIASDGQTGDEFGGQVSISENYFAVGAEFAETNTEAKGGAVYIFTYSNIWNELKKIISVDESGLIANQFGHSVDLKGDYLIIGSPNAANKGVADVFYKKRNWGHLKKITSDQTASSLFGNSVGIDYPTLVVGASGFTDTTDEGKIYIFEDPEVRLRLAQEFDADFQPSKASIYLKRSGSNSSSSWLLTDNEPTIIDATNFSTISKAEVVDPLDMSNSTILHYKMNDNEASTTVIDSEGLSNGIYSGANTVDKSETGKIKTCLTFDGSSDYIDSNTDLESIFRNSFSVNCWVKKVDVTPTSTECIFGAGVISGICNLTFLNNNIIFNYKAGPGASVNAIAAHGMTSETWHMITANVEEVNTNEIRIKLYIDNVEIHNSGNLTSNMNSYASNNIFVGALNNVGSDDCHLEGEIDDFRVFDKILTEVDRNFLYNDGDGTENLAYPNSELIFEDEIGDFTGNGHITSRESSYSTTDYPTINYPIRSLVPDNYNVWMRCRTGSEDISGSSVFVADILLDGIIVKEISTVIADGEWSWVNTTLVLPDIRQHILGIKIKENLSKIDKIILSADTDFTPEGNGPPQLSSPYVTIHLKVYDSDGFAPTDPLNVYSYKTTLDEVIQDDWYNFDISFTDTVVSEYGQSLFLVMSSSGANLDNFVLWEVVDSDEYSPWSTALRLTEIGSVFSSEYLFFTNRLYYQAKDGNADINTDVWYLDNTKKHAFKIYSDFDPIRDI